jgi:hypothetical protein
VESVLTRLTITLALFCRLRTGAQKGCVTHTTNNMFVILMEFALAQQHLTVTEGDKPALSAVLDALSALCV